MPISLKAGIAAALASRTCNFFLKALASTQDIGEWREGFEVCKEGAFEAGAPQAYVS